MPATAPVSTLGYRLMVALAALPLLLTILRRAWKYRDKDFLYQSYAFNLPPDLKGRACLQCTGIGEFRAAIALIASLESSGMPVFTCCSHPRTRDIAKKTLPHVPCVYFPADHGFVVRRWLRHMAPRAVVIVEGELWPNFISAASSANPPVPLSLVNARLSKRITAPPWLARRSVSRSIQQLRCVLTRDQEDAERFVAHGARDEKAAALGNLKYAAVNMELASPRPIDERIPYVLAISTREGEEELILGAWTTLSTKNHLLVLMPRSPARVPKLMQRLNPLGLNIGLHSRDKTPNPTMDVYIVDTLGEALPWLQHAEFVFVGGSLVPKYGGQNVLEPAALGRACVVGPHTENFRSEVKALLEAGGLVQITDRESLRSIFSRWLSDPAEARLAGDRGRDHVSTYQDIAERCIQTLRDYKAIPPPPCKSKID